MGNITKNPLSRKFFITMTVAVGLVLIVPSPARWKLASAFVGVFIGNQVGTLLDIISKKFRIIGFLILLWNGYSLASGKIVIDEGTPVNLAAFLWGFGFLMSFPQKEMALFRS
jgi:flagellar biosynthesis protein FliR